MAAVSDPIADMMTRIRNAADARHTNVRVPVSKIKLEIAKILLVLFLAAYLSEQAQQGRLHIEDSVLAAQQFGALVLHQRQLKDDLGIEMSLAKEDTDRTAEEASTVEFAVHARFLSIY